MTFRLGSSVRTDVDIEVVRTLLDHGADPNVRMEFTMGTIWEQFLREVELGNDKIDVDDLFQFAELFLLHGADPVVKCLVRTTMCRGSRAASSTYKTSI